MNPNLPLLPTEEKPVRATQQSSVVALASTIKHPYLNKNDSESIRVFLRKYDKYVVEIEARAKQLGDEMSSTTAKPISLVFCVDAEYLESAIALGFIPGVSRSGELTDEKLRSYLEGKATESKDTITLNSLNALVSKNLRTNMHDPSATSRMQSLFIQYHTLLRKHGVQWVLVDAQKVAVQHVLSAIQPKSLQDRLRSDLEFAHYHLRKDFKGFVAHAIKLAEVFQLVDDGKPKENGNKSKSSKSKPGNNPKGGGGSSSTGEGKEPTQRKATKGEKDDSAKPERKPPLCIMPRCRDKKKRHFFDDCPEPKEEIEAMKKSLEKPPSSNTRSKASSNKSDTADTQPATKQVGAVLNHPHVPLWYSLENPK